MFVEWLSLIILLLLSGFFSGLETAYTSLNHIEIKRLREKHKQAVLLDELKNQSHKLITTILICNNLVNITASALVTYMTITIVGSAAIGLSTGMLTLVVLIFGEVTPKKVALDHHEFVCLHTAKIMGFMMAIFTPLVWILDKMSYFLSSIFARSEEKPKITEEDIVSAVEIGEEIGELEPHERRMIHNIFKFNDIEVEHIMTHRTDVFSVDEKTRIKEVIDEILEKGYSRIPVFRETNDNIVGVLLLKDIIPFIKNKKSNPKIKDMMIKPLFVPDTRKIDAMLKDFKKEKTHIAVVIDDKGGVSGIVTIEDVLEEIVGEIYDEKDVVHKAIRKINKNSYFVKGDAEIEDVNEELGLKISAEEDYETISSYILRKTGEMPKVGKEIKLNKGKFIIEIVQNNRIELVKFLKK